MTIRKLAWLALAGGMVIAPVTAAIAAKVIVVRSIGPSAKAYPRARR